MKLQNDFNNERTRRKRKLEIMSSSGQAGIELIFWRVRDGSPLAASPPDARAAAPSLTIENDTLPRASVRLPLAGASLIFAPMKYRRFGRTELVMPVISCGGMRYQFTWQDADPKEIPHKNQENLEATIHRALELGINHIETARGYGTSEMQLGNVLPKLPRDKIIVQTKVTPRATPEEFLGTFETSMKYLKLDHVDLLRCTASTTANCWTGR